jgi:hypothetical protein
MRKSPTIDTVRALFAKSGNKCAFPGCVCALLNDKNKFIGEICHIESAESGGERFNLSQSDEERRNYDNLILMCHPHHIETNDTELYSVEKLKEIKYNHELNFRKNIFKIDETALYKIVEEMNDFWEKIDRLNTVEHTMKELAYHISAKSSCFEIIDECRENITILRSIFDSLANSDIALEKDFHNILRRKSIDPSQFSDIPYYENPFINRNWEYHNLGAPNRMGLLDIHLTQIELKYLEEYLKTNSDDSRAKERLKTLKKEFAYIAQNAAVAD